MSNVRQHHVTAELLKPPYRLRPLLSGDAQAFALAVRESTATVGRWMSWSTPTYTELQAVQWFEQCASYRAAGSAHEFGIFNEHGEFVGGAGLNQFNAANSFCNLGYWVRESAQGRGAATAACLALARLALERLGQHRVELVVAVGNEPSRAVAAKVDALYEGVARNRLQLHGAAVDAHVYCLLPRRAA